MDDVNKKILAAVLTAVIGSTVIQVFTDLRGDPFTGSDALTLEARMVEHVKQEVLKINAHDTQNLHRMLVMEKQILNELEEVKDRCNSRTTILQQCIKYGSTNCELD